LSQFGLQEKELENIVNPCKVVTISAGVYNCYKFHENFLLTGSHRYLADAQGARGLEVTCTYILPEANGWRRRLEEDGADINDNSINTSCVSDFDAVYYGSLRIYDFNS